MCFPDYNTFNIRQFPGQLRIPEFRNDFFNWLQACGQLWLQTYPIPTKRQLHPISEETKLELIHTTPRFHTRVSRILEDRSRAMSLN